MLARKNRIVIITIVVTCFLIITTMITAAKSAWMAFQVQLPYVINHSTGEVWYRMLLVLSGVAGT